MNKKVEVRNDEDVFAAIDHIITKLSQSKLEREYKERVDLDRVGIWLDIIDLRRNTEENDEINSNKIKYRIYAQHYRKSEKYEFTVSIRVNGVELIGRYKFKEPEDLKNFVTHSLFRKAYTTTVKGTEELLKENLTIAMKQSNMKDHCSDLLSTVFPSRGSEKYCNGAKKVLKKTFLKVGRVSLDLYKLNLMHKYIRDTSEEMLSSDDFYYEYN